MTPMTPREHEALACIGLLAAQSDGRRDPAEMERLAAVFSTFGSAGIAGAHARVALGSAALEEEAAALTTPELRQAAWELAAGVCAADGATVEREQVFLERLRIALGMPAEATALAVAPLAAFAEPAAASAAASVDAKIQQAAILAAALELLPQGLATLGILPVQLKLVADIGTAAGHKVDASHAKELLATVGLGLSGQAVEGFARRFLGGLAGRLAGGGIGGLVNAATGSAATFAATWAIGQVARSWYASNRSLDPDDVKARFAHGLADGQAAFGRLEQDVATKARSIRL